MIDLDAFESRIQSVDSYSVRGRVCQIVGTVIEGFLPGAEMGTICDIVTSDEGRSLMSEVVGFRGDRVLLAPYGSIKGVNTQSAITPRSGNNTILVGESLLGRVIDGLGNPIDESPLPDDLNQYPLYNDPPNPILKKSIAEPLDLGIRAINSLYTCGKGQRVALMAGSGVGKSVLMGMISKNVKADINVIALIGERGREVREFIEKDLGEEGLKRSIVVVVSSDKSPLLRVRGANLATSIAEYFRDQGKDVLLMMDSITRFAHAQREIGLAVGEPPTTKGYPPSVFSTIPKLLERVGTGPGKGTITGIYTVLVDQDDFNDPITDAVRGTLDGHIVLSRELAMQGIFPAIDIESSLSRVMVDIVKDEHWQMALRLKQLHSTYERSRTIIEIGAYNAGSDGEIDQAISLRPSIFKLLKQGMKEKAPLYDSIKNLEDLVHLDNLPPRLDSTIPGEGMAQ